MATLNVKEFPESLYERLRERARREHRSIAQEVIHILSRELQADERLSLLDLRGLGKEAWKDVDPTDHVERERSSWD